jgi:hypothetical protein
LSPEAIIIQNVVVMVDNYEGALVPEDRWWEVVRGLAIEAPTVGQGTESQITAAANTSLLAPSPVQLSTAGAPLAAALPIPCAPSPIPLLTAGAPLIADVPIPRMPSPLPPHSNTADAIQDSTAVNQEMATAHAPPPSLLVKPTTVTGEAATAKLLPPSDEGMLVDVPGASPPSPLPVSVTTEMGGDVLDLTSPSSP